MPWLAGKKYDCNDHLPRPKDFPKALYIFDIGQNDIAYGLRTVSDTQLVASIPDMITQLTSQIQVTLPFFSCNYAN